MGTSRQEVCKSASQKLLAALTSLPSIGAVVGFDGFVDEIIAVVDKRHDKDRYDPVKTIDAFGKKVLTAAGQSSNYELLVKQIKLGGNGPIMANALAAMGLGVTYVGNLGYPALHPVFNEFAERANVISIAEPGHTDALEFEDGKLMLGKHQSLHDITWDNLIERVGKGKITELYSQAKLIGMVNWTMIPSMSQIWNKLREEVLAGLPKQGRRMFIDLADPEKRTRQDIKEALQILARFSEHLDVILGLNLKEAIEIADVLGLAARGDPEAEVESLARDIRAKLKVACVVVHPRRGAAAATASESGYFAGPFVQQPKISTGAGDHFNAGFALGSVIGLGLEESLCCGVATSGYYVRSAQSPSGKQLAEFIAKLPPPQE
ncbi:MAG: PfkB family carbohydrate kinase [Planctomycetota bacterium]|nr:PfkB family carbohydrate kinase [Planctomycetota bacterium]